MWRVIFSIGGANVLADINITQAEADALIALEKIRVDDKAWLFPNPGEQLVIPLSSVDKRESFTLDVTRSRIKLTKSSYQNRAHQAIVLIRLDVDGAPHRNPDGIEIPCPHLHIYREGFGDKWATPAPIARYRNTQDLYSTLWEFLDHCNVIQLPQIEKGLFS